MTGRAVMVGSENALPGMRAQYEAARAAVRRSTPRSRSCKVAEADPKDHERRPRRPAERGRRRAARRRLHGRRASTSPARSRRSRTSCTRSRSRASCCERTDHCQIFGADAYRFARAVRLPAHRAPDRGVARRLDEVEGGPLGPGRPPRSAAGGAEDSGPVTSERSQDHTGGRSTARCSPPTGTSPAPLPPPASPSRSPAASATPPSSAPGSTATTSRAAPARPGAARPRSSPARAR